MKRKWQMKAEPAECRVCYMCQMVCSLKQDSTFNPSKAYVEISRAIKSTGELDVGVSFTDECDSCGLCAKYCVYKVISRERMPSASDAAG